MTLQEKIQKGLDCWCDRFKADTKDDCKKHGCPYADSESECSTEILWDVDILLWDIAAKDSSKAEDKQTVTPDMVRKKLLDNLCAEYSTLWDSTDADKETLLREMAYDAGMADMCRDVCKMLEGG